MSGIGQRLARSPALSVANEDRHRFDLDDTLKLTRKSLLLDIEMIHMELFRAPDFHQKFNVIDALVGKLNNIFVRKKVEETLD